MSECHRTSMAVALWSWSLGFLTLKPLPAPGGRASCRKDVEMPTETHNWLVKNGIPPLDYEISRYYYYIIIIPSMLTSTIPELIINQAGFKHCSSGALWWSQSYNWNYFLRVIPALAHHSDVVSDVVSDIPSKVLLTSSDILSGSFWHLFWHSFRQSFWHSIWHIYLAIFLAVSLAYMLAFCLASSLAWVRESSHTPQPPELAIWCAGPGKAHCIRSCQRRRRGRGEEKWHLC